MLRILATCCFVVVLFDAVAAWASRLSGISYSWFAIPQMAMYFGMGYILCCIFGLDRRFFTVLISAAFSEATIGWWISALIGPGKPGNVSTVLLLITILIGVAVQTAFGVIGGWVAKKLGVPQRATP